ncbi:hypothetical protein A3Q56_08142, partial [Intoshia linei]
MYVTATAPYILLIILLIRGLTMKGSTEGLYYYLSPNWNKLFNTEVWVDAGTQIFFSYSISLGTLPAIGSYNSNNHNVLSVLGAMASDLNVDISEVVASGPGLTFIIYPRAILMLPYPNLWTIIFFIMMFFLGLDSQFVGVEGLITALKDSNLINMEGKRSMVVTAFVCTVLYLLGIPMITEVVYQVLQHFTSMCYIFFDSDNSFLQHLNFTRDEIIILHHGIEGVINQTGKRGRSPKICTLDSVIIFLYWLKHGHQFKLIAKIFGFTTNLIQKSIDRMLSPFYQHLSQKWWNHRKRPIAMEGNYPYLALAID